MRLYALGVHAIASICWTNNTLTAVVHLALRFMTIAITFSAWLVLMTRFEKMRMKQMANLDVNDSEDSQQRNGRVTGDEMGDDQGAMKMYCTLSG